MEDGSKWRMVIRCNNYVWLYFLSIPLPSPSALTSRWRAAKSALVQPALAPQLSLPVCVLQTKIGLSKGQHNARQLKGSHFCLLLSISLNHTFSKWKKKKPGLHIRTCCSFGKMTYYPVLHTSLSFAGFIKLPSSPQNGWHLLLLVSPVTLPLQWPWDIDEAVIVLP